MVFAIIAGVAEIVVGLRRRDERRESDSVIQAHFFQLFARLPDLLPEDDTKALRGTSSLVRDLH
ncbi:MAG: hypothetical protein WB586_00040 [Chthoniobacterales bacterium]